MLLVHVSVLLQEAKKKQLDTKKEEKKKMCRARQVRHKQEKRDTENTAEPMIPVNP